MASHDHEKYNVDVDTKNAAEKKTAIRHLVFFHFFLLVTWSAETFEFIPERLLLVLVALSTVATVQILRYAR
jgi:hypothetical protein